MEHEKLIARCYELAIAAGKKGYDTFGALLEHDGIILEEAENTTDRKADTFGHAEFNLVHKCANSYPEHILREAVFYTSCAPCERCLAAIASLGIETVVYGVSYRAFSKLIPNDYTPIDYEPLLKKMNLSVKMIGPVSEEDGMRVFEYWGGEYHPLEELIASIAEIKRKNKESAEK